MPWSVWVVGINDDHSGMRTNRLFTQSLLQPGGPSRVLGREKALQWKPEKAQASSSWRSLAWGSCELASQQQASRVLVLAFSNWFWVGRMSAASNQVLPFWGRCCSLPRRPPRLLQSSWVSLLHKVCPLWVCIQALRVVSSLWLQDFAHLIQCDTKINNSLNKLQS